MACLTWVEAVYRNNQDKKDEIKNGEREPCMRGGRAFVKTIEGEQGI